MARRGRPSVPLELKIANGTYRRDRDGVPPKEMSQTISALPKPPSELGKNGKAAWKRIGEKFISMKIFTDNDFEMFHILCETFDFEAKLDKEISSLESMFIINAKGDIVPHPAVKLRRDCLRDRSRMMRLFGMSPSDRSSVVRNGSSVDPKVSSTVASRKRV